MNGFYYLPLLKSFMSRKLNWFTTGGVAFYKSPCPHKNCNVTFLLFGPDTYWICIHIQIMRKFEDISKFSVQISLFSWKKETFHLIFDHSLRTSCLWYWFYGIILSECDIAFLCCSLISSLSSSASATLPILLCWRQMSKSFRMPLTQNTFDEKEKKDLKITKKVGYQILCSPNLRKNILYFFETL